MRINPRINKQVSKSVAECRKSVINATIDLLKKLGAKDGQEVTFRKVLFLHKFKNGTSETRPADRVSYSDNVLITSLGDDYPASSHYLSIDNLLLIYEEVKKVVRTE